MVRSHRTAALLCTTLATIAAAGQPESDPSQVLSGPAVRQQAAPATLVKRDFNGRLERIDTRPESAAVQLLTLTDEEQAAVDAFFAKRAADVTAALFEHMDLFLEIQSARQSGDLAGTRPLMRQLREKVPNLIDPPLSNQVAAVLPEGVRSEFTRLVDEYTQALAAEESATRGGGGGDAANRPAANRPAANRPAANDRGASVRFESSQLIREMARTLSAVVSERRERTEAMLAAINATPEQQAKITAILRRSEESAEPGAEGDMRSTLTPSAQRRDQSIRQIMELLTPEQRRKLREFLWNPG